MPARYLAQDAVGATQPIADHRRVNISELSKWTLGAADGQDLSTHLTGASTLLLRLITSTCLTMNKIVLHMNAQTKNNRNEKI